MNKQHDETREEWIARYTTIHAESLAFNRGQRTPYDAEGCVRDWHTMSQDAWPAGHRTRRYTQDEQGNDVVVEVAVYQPSDDDIREAYRRAEEWVDRILEAHMRGRAARETTE